MQTRPKPQMLSASAPAHKMCAEEIMEVVPKLARFIGQEMRRQSPVAVSMPQLKVLNFIKRNPGTSLSSAADDLGVTKASASDLIDRLVKKGYVARVEDPHERRKVLLTLTAAGEIFLLQMRGIARASAADILNGLPASKLSKAIEGLRVLKDAFKEV